MPAEPIRERTMAAIAAQLATIQAGSVVYTTPAGSTHVEYWSTPSLIARDLQWLPQYDQPLVAGNPETQLDRGPVVGVVRASGSEFTLAMHAAPSGRVADAFEHRQRLTIWGYVKGTPDELAATRLERLNQDTVECLLVDPTLGGLALKIEPDGPIDTDDGAMEPLGFFAQDWLVLA